MRKVVITALLGLCLSVSSGADKTASSKIRAMELLPITIESLNPKDDRTDHVALEMLERARSATNRIAVLEGGIPSLEGSPWEAAVRTGLAAHYRQTGNYSRALSHWKAAWTLVQGSSARPAFIDGLLAQWASLLASLGREEELRVLFEESHGHHFQSGSWARHYADARDGAELMRTYPEMSFRCGTLALRRVGETLGATNIGNLISAPSPRSGFSLGELESFSSAFAIPVVARKRQAGANEIVVPSVVHWKVGHYAAVIRKTEYGYLVVDPTFGRSVELSGDTINEEMSGYCLIPHSADSASWETLSAEEGANIRGKGQPNSVDDSDDEGCNPTPEGITTSADSALNDSTRGCEDCPGMARWWVSEPWINLHVGDEPLAYYTSTSEKVAFKFKHTARGVPPALQVFNPAQYDRHSIPRNIGMTNAAFHHNWDSRIRFRHTSFVGHNAVIGGNWEAVVYMPNGGYRYYSSLEGAVDGRSRTGLERMRNLDGNYNPENLCGSGGTNGFRLSYSDGSVDYFEYVTRNLDTIDLQGTAYLTKRLDQHGRAFTVCYETNAALSSMVISRVKSVTDYEGRTSTFSYEPNDAELLTGIEDPYGRTTTLSYYTNGVNARRVMTITDATELKSTFEYLPDNWGFLSAIKTPYGKTSFTYTSDVSPESGLDQGNMGGHNRIARTIRVEEPDGAKHLYLFRFEALDLVPDSYPTNEVPVVAGASFDNGTATSTNVFGSMRFRNSFYWGPKQHAALSTSVITNMTAEDYNKARMRHWLDSQISTTNGTSPMSYVTDRISMERAPSTDAAGNVEGFKTFYSYANKITADKGGEPEVGWIAHVTPGQGTRYVKMEHDSMTQRLKRVISSFTDSSGALSTRTAGFSYAGNGIDLATVTNFNGQKVAEFLYNSTHQITNAVTPLGTHRFTYHPTTLKMTGHTLPSGLARKFFYSQFGLLSRIEDEGVDTNYFSFNSGNPIRTQNGRGFGVTNFFDGLNRLTGQAFPDENDGPNFTTTTNLYHRLDGQTFPNSSGGTNLLQVTAHRDRNGNWTKFGYSPGGQLQSITDANTNTTLLGYCDCGTLESVTNAANEKLTFVYDNQVRLGSVIFPDTSTLSYQRDFLGQVTNIVDHLNKALGITRNNQGLPTQLASAAGALAKLSYDSEDRLAKFTNVVGLVTSNFYDSLDRITNRAWSDSTQEHFRYTTNFFGPTVYTNAVGNVVTLGYDAAQRVATNGVPGLENYRFGYSASELGSITNGNDKVVSWVYNREGRPFQKKDHSGAVLATYLYYPNGWLSNRVDAGNGSVKFIYDGVGNLKTNVYASRVEKFTYDKVNRLKTVEDAVGATSFEYHPNGWLKKEDGPWASDTLDLTYTNFSRATLTLGQPSGSWQQSYGYDSSRRLWSVTSPAGAFNYYFKGASEQVQQLNLGSAGSVTNRMDNARSRLLSSSLRGAGGATLVSNSYTYIAGRQIDTVQRANLNLLDYGYDGAGRLTNLSVVEYVTGPSRWHENWGYKYDAAGNLTNRLHNHLNQGFGVDARNRINSLRNTGSVTVAGVAPNDVASVTVNGSAATLFGDKTFARTNAPISAAEFQAIGTTGTGAKVTNTIPNAIVEFPVVDYDNNGNLTRDGPFLYGYDEESRLTRVTLTNAPGESLKLEFVYDALSRRRIERSFTWSQSTWIPTSERRFIYDGRLLIQERDQQNTPVVTYTRGRDLSGSLSGAGGIGGLLARSTSATVHVYYHSDQSGNVIGLMNSSGQLVAEYIYNPFGQLIAKRGPMADQNRFRFSSKMVEDLSGTYDFGFRSYSPHLQRWLSEDPLGELGGLNLYRFNHNDAFNYIDPDGRHPLVVSAAIGAGVGAVIGGTIAYLNGGDVLAGMGRGALVGGLAGLGGGIGAGLFGEGLAGGFLGGALGGALGDALAQGGELAMGWRCEYDPQQTAFAAALGGALGAGAGLLKDAAKTLSKGDRLNLVYDRVRQAPRATTADEAMQQMHRTLNSVEDAFSGVPKATNPGLKPDGRMYPVQPDRMVTGAEGTITATSRGHITTYGRNGSITVTDRATGAVVFQKPGGG